MSEVGSSSSPSVSRCHSAKSMYCTSSGDQPGSVLPVRAT
ncbi:Uncharacterised protein [Mycobacteroides abscessus subsp. abscessus]|nr:Uncharacterised protein [Mycobacteroides abscessus subsp. abscessus]